MLIQHRRRTLRRLRHSKFKQRRLLIHCAGFDIFLATSVKWIGCKINQVPIKAFIGSMRLRRLPPKRVRKTLDRSLGVRSRSQPQQVIVLFAVGALLSPSCHWVLRIHFVVRVAQELCRVALDRVRAPLRVIVPEHIQCLLGLCGCFARWCVAWLFQVRASMKSAY